ncbi:hypothetical protein NA57DRAFT_77046 [Rhizodiscina lignyota]|uniref:DUF8212 domain-containing protein n=1 Tax=Rhizodiscina lignyota TaxID=1504668 RepID=A0A9P4IFN8_9PEZI|nr:hypothetical protein NA57DRAFT_77046 [Rhizodiscina lignyota]
MLYGEGRRAFTRLQKAIINISNDQSIFAWKSDNYDDNTHLFATNPSNFENCSTIVRLATEQSRMPFTMTNAGLSISLPPLEGFPGTDMVHLDCQTAILACRFENDFRGPIGLPLTYEDGVCTVWKHGIPIIRNEQAERAEVKPLLIVKDFSTVEHVKGAGAQRPRNPACWVRWPGLPYSSQISVINAYPSKFWNIDAATLYIPNGPSIRGVIHLRAHPYGDFVVTVGYTLGEWSKWISLCQLDETRDTLEELCASISGLDPDLVDDYFDFHSTMPWQSKQSDERTLVLGGLIKIVANIKMETIMGEKILVVDLKLADM